MNETHPSLDDLALFAHVARSGSLSATARALGIPLPTLSRRMKALEQCVGRALFLRGARGYALSVAGQALADELEGLEETRRRVARWQRAEAGPQPVRLTAGTWTSRHLARNLPLDDPLWSPVFLPSNARLDLARREADVGLRNAPPDHPWLARRKIARVHFALFGRPEVVGFVAGPSGTPSQDWLQTTHGTEVRVTAPDPRLCLDLALAGQGQIVLPTFAAKDTGLTQRSDIIDVLSHDVWLVMHQDTRHDPPIRAAIEAITALFQDL